MSIPYSSQVCIVLSSATTQKDTMILEALQEIMYTDIIQYRV